MSTRPFSRFEWMLAGRYLRPTRREGFVSIISILSFLGIAVGVAALIIVMSVMNGFRHDLLSRILGIRGHVMIQGVQGALPDFDQVAKQVRGVAGVVSATPVVEGQVMASSNGASYGVLVHGIRAKDLAAMTMVSKSLEPGALDNFDGSESVIIGTGLANNLRLAPGMNLTLIAPRGNVTPFGVTPRIKTYRIAGLFKIGMSEYDRSYVFMPLKEAQLFFNMGATVNELQVMIDDPDKADAMAVPIGTAAGVYARVITWQDVNSTFFGAIQVERNVMFLILSLIVLVAALNIISGLIMLVKDKTQDIAILRTMGATRGAMMRVFMIAGASIGVTGTLVGFVIGTVFCANIETIRQFLSHLTGTTLFDPTIYFLERMPAEMDASEVTAVVLMALTLSFLATLYPSWSAARLDPVEALRNE
ncbi:MAG TPA: lipoprotein-releasing ABC transporter permease subunit [Rhizomicrobium sp.]|nr:lipoprotein-releasing ABC transporter permease subunit [Rhizomicrobium sp.]